MFDGFKDFLNEMLLNGEPGGDNVIAFRQWLWVVRSDSDLGDDIVEKVVKSHPKGEELVSHLESGEIHDIMDWLRDYVPDAVVGNWSPSNKILYIQNSGSMTASPTTSPAIRKVALQLGARRVNYETLGNNDEEKTVSKSAGRLRGGWNAPWYHGTSTNYVEGILRLGLKPGERDSNYGDQGIVHDDLVFLSSKLEEAQYHGWHTAKKVGGLPVVLRINKIPDESLIRPDYDVDNMASRGFYNNPPRKSYDPSFAVDSYKASKHAGLIGYSGRIPASRIDSLSVFSTHENKWKRIPDLGKLSAALKRVGEDLWIRYGDPVQPSRRRY